MKTRIMSPEDQHPGIMEYYRRNLGEPERMISMKNGVYVEVVRNTAGGRFLQFNNLKWRPGEKLRFQMILACISPDSIVKHMGLQRQLNFKNEGPIKDRHGHGNHSCQEDQSDREIQDAPASVAGYHTSGARMERRRAAGRRSVRKIMKMPTSWYLHTVMTRPSGGEIRPVDETSRKELEMLQGALPSTGGNMPGEGLLWERAIP